MPKPPFRLAALLLTALALASLAMGTGSAQEDEVPLEEFRCDGGWCLDGEDRVVDCSAGHCQGDASPYGFPTLVDPVMGDGAWLEADDPVLGVALHGEARAYPLRVLTWYETVRDVVGGEAVLVTYCPLCASGVVFSPVADGRSLTLLNSGEIWRSDLVMYDRETESRWTQIWGQAIHGPLTGARLPVVPSTRTTWEAWRGTHSDGQAMEPPTDAQGDPLWDFGRVDFRDLELVHGVIVKGKALAFSLDAVEAEGVVHTTLADVRLVAVYAGEGVRVYRTGDRAFRDHNATFVRDDRGIPYHKLTGASPTGEDLVPLEGKTLYRFAWENFHPDTAYYGARPADSPSLASRLPTLLAVAATAGVAALLYWLHRRPSG